MPVVSQAPLAAALSLIERSINSFRDPSFGGVCVEMHFFLKKSFERNIFDWIKTKRMKYHVREIKISREKNLSQIYWEIFNERMNEFLKQKIKNVFKSF